MSVWFREGLAMKCSYTSMSPTYLKICAVAEWCTGCFLHYEQGYTLNEAFPIEMNKWYPPPQLWCESQPTEAFLALLLLSLVQYRSNGTKPFSLL